MRRSFPVLLAGGVIALGAVALRAQDAPPAEYVKAMQAIRAASQTLTEFAKTQDFDAVAKTAPAARTAFQYVETFWNERKDVKAAQLATTGARAAGDAAAAAGLKSAEGIEFAAKQMSETCMACHDAHRVRRDDGSFAIK
jgi:cytochrome c556